MKSGSCTAQSLKWKSLVVVTVLVMQIGQLEAQTERFLQSLSGAFKKGDSCVVKDDKFSVPEKWASIEKHLSVENIITFELRYDTQANYFNRNFSCTLQADIEYETADRIKEQIKNVSLELNYDTAAGVTHQGIAWYKFKNGHHVKLTVKKITSAAWGNKLPPIFRIRNEIIIDRLYLLDTKKPLEKVTVSNAKIVADRILLQKVTGIDHNGARIAGEVDKHLTIQWDVSDPSFPQYDIEWTFYDATSMIGNKIQDGTFDFSQGALESVFKNNSSRVTVSIPVYQLPEVYNKGWIFYRIRGVRFDEITGTRTEAVWSYAGNYLFNNFTYGLLEVAGHEELLNWQYTISFAEEGKRKEIVNYFDGSLRHRQLVTLSNDNAGSTAIVQENIFDALGRPAVNVLPAPTEETGIHYFQLFNRSAVTGSGYSYTDFDIPASCATAPSAMSTATGASQYYSPLNPRKSDNSNAFFFSKYIPDAFGYPFVVTAFTPDNTDRIRVQGGNGFLYQPGKVTASDDHTTRYYYATPQQDELDRLFGNEAGNAGHFLKNMVIDENGQASIAYINASGKTVATALAGNHPDNVQALPSCQLTNTEVITTLTDRDNIVRDEAALTLTYNSAFLAAATGAITLHYTFIPLSLQVLYGVQNEKICADCYYDLIINVSDDCGNQIQSINKEAVFTEKITCSPAPVEQEGEFPVTISHPGEYHITYRLQLSRKAIDYYVDQYLLQNTALKKEIDFQRDYLHRLDLSACFNNCETCLADLGDEQHFIARITNALQQDSITPNDGDVVWIKGMYRQLLDACTLSQLGCGKTVLPCEEQTVQLKEDVRPGGQYMLFDAGSGRFIDRDLNVFLRNRDALTAQVNFNGTARPFNQLTESDIINNWQDEWSDLLLPYHPENKNNCLIADCEKNAGVEQYEKLFFNTTDAAAAKSRLFWFQDDYLSVIDNDVYFKPGSEGAAQKASFANSLSNYRESGTDIMSFVRWSIYCQVKAAGDQYPAAIVPCARTSACNREDDEWALFRTLYYSARQELRNNSTGCNSNNLFPGAAAALSTENPANIASPPTETPAGFFQISNSNGNVAVQYTGAQTIPADVTVQYFAVDGTNEISGGDGGQVLFMKGNPPGTIKTINGKAALVYIIDFARVNLTHPYYSKTRRNYNGISLAGVTGALQGNTAAGINASAMATMVGECNESCEQNADGWMQKLAGCNLDISSEAYIQIREGLLAVCKSSCQVNVSDHPFGASSSGTGTTTGDKNFRDVLQRVLGNEKFSAVCNDLLLDYPQAGNVHPLYVNESVRSLQPCSYAALQSWKQAWLLHPEFSSFADFIKIYIDPDFSLSNGQLTILQSAFENNCITPQPLRLPASLSCTGTQAKTCLTCSELLDVKLNFSTAFPYIAADDPEYYTLLAKYVNRTFNFNLSSVDVFDALAHCNETSVSATDTIVPGLFSAAYQQFQQLQPGYFTNPDSNIGADSLYRNYLTLWLNTALHRQLNFDYYKQYATGNGIRFDYPDSHVTPGCDSNTAFVNCAAKFITCCEPFEELEKFRKVFPDSVNARLLALYFSFLRTEWCSPVNLPAINYNVPYDSIVAYFSHFQLADGYTVTVRPDSLIEYTVSTNSSCHAVALNFLKDISSSGGTLRYAVCNKPLQPSVAIDDNACISLQVNTATSNAHSDYLEYIETTRRDYRNAYYTKCLSITPRLTLQALYNEPLEYHYTLYYYDQAGNLVKTIPPAGVVPVDIATDGAEKMQRIKNFRLADRDNCFEYGDAAGMNGTASITIRDNPLIQQAAAPFTIESFVQFTSLEGEQVLLAKQSVNALDNKLDGYRFYLNAGRLRFDLAAHGQEQWVQTISKITPYVWPNPYAALPPVNIRTEVNIPLERSLYRSISAQVSSDLSTLISSGEWVYLAVQYTADPNDPVRIFINGNLLSTELVSNKSEYTPAVAAPLSAAEIAAGSIETGFAYRSTTVPLSTGNGSSADFVIGAGTGGLSGSIKQVRLYNRVLPASEILNNATNTCLMPQSTGALVIWLPLNKELSAGVSVDRINQLPTVNNNTAFTAVYQPVYPAHVLPSHYFFNSLNAVTKQVNPDAGETNFFYDLPGRLMASQNAEQKISSRGEGDNRYSYTKFDLLGRVVETGEKSGAPVLTNLIAASDPTVSNSAVNRWLGSGTNTQIAQTIYDQPNTTVVRNAVVTGSQNIYNTSRKRVVAFVYRATAGSLADYSHATHYQYDISGNIKRLWQEYRQSATGEPVNMLKELLYDFDLVSGKVNQLTYQPGKGDQFIYRYEYDPENRLLRAYSGRDINTLQQDAGYRYYLHGPLARLELGDASTSRIVQGIDYTYTLQGWLKGVNGFQLSSSGLLGEADAGKDGSSVAKAGFHAGIAADALAYTLGYNANDYAPIGGVASSAFAARYQHPLLSATAITGKELFNGNISNATYATSGIDAGSTHGYSYGYDQLNRVMAVRSHNLDNIIPGSAWNNASVLDDYSEDFRYDPNGNLLHVLRNGTGKAGRNLAMDDMRYNYYYSDNNGERKTYIPGLPLPADAWKLTNQLSHISDAVPATNYPVAAFPAEKDIDDQRSNNYDYDEIGNLVKDQAEGISKINWTVYGKIQSITKTDGTRIEYEYDSGGNRILKRVVEGNTTFIDYYVRDAQGNNIALYSWKGATGSIPRPAADGNGIAGQVWAEQYLYGSTRLGMWKPNITMPPILDTKTDAVQVGSKFFELSNHLGNVLAVISDRKIAVPASNNPTVTDHYTAEVISATDYTVFGMPMAGRQYNLTPSYRFGFNGKENDNEVKGSGSQQDYGMRVYDPRAGRFLTVDPIRAAYPMLTPYQFASNNPVSGIDQDGLEYSPAGKVGIFSIDQTAVQLYPDNPNIIIQQKANAPMVHLANEIARIHSQPVYLSSQWQPGSAFEKQRYEINKRAWYDRDGYNEDGSARPLTKLAGNKTWMALSANLAMPFFDFAAYADGEGEMLALLEVAAKNTSRETITALVDKLLMSSGTIRSLDEKAVVGYRGSLATGTKFKTGAPFNPTDFDVDAFIVSDKLAKQIGNRSFRNGSSIKDLKDLSKDYEKIFKQIPGYRTSRNKPFTFRVFTNEEFNTKVKLTGFKTF